MMKMATGDGFPLRQGAEQAPERFLVATEACGSGTPDLFCSAMFLGYMDIYIGEGSRSGEPRGAHEGGGRAQGGGRAPCLVPSSLLPLRTLQVFWIASVPKITLPKVHSVWTPFDIPFLRNTETREKTETITGLWVNRLVPK